jgi:hypothetical protein
MLYHLPLSAPRRTKSALLILQHFERELFAGERLLPQSAIFLFMARERGSRRVNAR